MINKPLLGELLVSQKLVSQDVIDEALRLQIGGNRRLGHILVRMKAITDDQLAETLAGQLGVSITEVKSQFSHDVKRILPRYLCNQYGVLPLRFKANNVLEVAMANPSDLEAINDIEHYTGMVVEPRLARHSDIDREIPKCIPLGIKDFFAPKVNTMANRVIATLALVCVVGLAMYTYDYIKMVHYGTVSLSGDLVLYHNHDLTIAVNTKGSYALQGHGAFSDGLYKVEFADLQNLEKFIEQRDRDFSGEQRTWLKWALEQAEEIKAKQVVAKN